MRYDGKALIPPRAELHVLPSMLDQREDEGWWLQLKMNGANSLIRRDAHGRVTTWSRHGTPHKAWRGFSKTAREFVQSIPGGDVVLNGELLFGKTPTLRETHPEGIHYVFDILVFDGEYLFGMAYGERFKLLDSLFPRGVSMPGYRAINNHFWVARNLRSGFSKPFTGLNRPEQEGVVLKDPAGTLQFQKSTWMLKCRREGHTNRFIKH